MDGFSFGISYCFQMLLPQMLSKTRSQDAAGTSSGRESTPNPPPVPPMLAEAIAALVNAFSEADQKISKLEREKEVDTKRIADFEYALSAQVELHKSEVLRLEKKLDEVRERFEVEKEKRKISDTGRTKV
jgi:hypothetical protein